MKVTVISLIFLLCILLTFNVYAMRINEVEMNPAGGSAGKEWIELYNNGTEIDISGWTIWEGVSGKSGPKKINYNFSEGTILQAGEYYIIELPINTTLNNDGDFVTLYNSSMQQVDQTPNLNDSYADARTWQLCDGNWKFFNSTKERENNCPTEEETSENNETQEDDSSEETDLDSNEENTSEKAEEIIQEFIPSPVEEGQNPSVSYNQDDSDTIHLSSNDNSKETFVSSEGKLRNYALYSFMALVIFLCIYLAFKRL